MLFREGIISHMFLFRPLTRDYACQQHGDRLVELVWSARSVM